jgi:hypothetical protein
MPKVCKFWGFRGGNESSWGDIPEDLHLNAKGLINCYDRIHIDDHQQFNSQMMLILPEVYLIELCVKVAKDRMVHMNLHFSSQSYQ